MENPKSSSSSSSSTASSQSADQLLRLHVINAKFNAATKEHKETYCVITVGKKNAKTLFRPLTGPKDKEKEVKWDENFAIEYEKKDEESFILVEVYAKATLKDELLGEFKLKVNEIDAPKAKEEKDGKKDKKDKKKEKEETWASAKPRDAALTDKKGTHVGSITLRIRRELKLHGNLIIDIKEAELPEATKVKKSQVCCQDRFPHRRNSFSRRQSFKEPNPLHVEGESSPVIDRPEQPHL